MKPAGSFREALLVYSREVRGLVRDRHTVIYSVFLPLFLYPSLVWAVVQGTAYMRGMEARRKSIVSVSEASPNQDLAAFLASREGVSLSSPVATDEVGAREALRSGAVDAAVLFDSSEGFESAARVFFNSANDSSAKARRRLEDALKDFRQERLATAVRASGDDPDEVLDVVSVEEQDLATPGELANYIAALMLPLIMSVITALGALYPALDTTVGEKERGTLETTLVSPARRTSIVAGKYLAVVTFALAAFALNFGSMAFTLFHLGSQLKLDKISIEPSAILVIIAGAILLALFLSAVMMLIGFVARTFKEGQTYVTPVYLLAVLPSVLLSSPDTVLTPWLACLPIVNLSLLFREALKGSYPLSGIAIALATSAAYSALALLFASRLLRHESYATGSGVPLRAALAGLWRAK